MIQIKNSLKKQAIIAWGGLCLSLPLLGFAQTSPSDFQHQLQAIEQTMDQPGPVTVVNAPNTGNANTPGVGVSTTTTTTPTTAVPIVTAPITNRPTMAVPVTVPINEVPVAAAPAATPVVVNNALNLPSPTVVNNNRPTPTTTVNQEGQQETTVNNLDLRDEAFSRMAITALPLSPSQIELLRNLYDATQRAAAVFPGVPPRPTSTSIAVNLSPGATPPVIRLGAGFVTSLVFVDASGAPWPIESYSLGNPNAFNIQWDKKSNILLIQAIAAHRVGNLAVILRGLNTPIMIDLSPGQAAMDVRVDLRIPRLGPEARPASYDSLPGTESPYLLNLLDGIPPPGAKSLTSSGCDNCVWLLDGKLYLRTQFTVISPGWISTMSSADGTHVYEMQPTPMILASFEGKMIKMRIEGF
ncbi:MAG: DotH/IcmK family type IV secretion protein [Gammaproteobacteria bacterium]